MTSYLVVPGGRRHKRQAGQVLIAILLIIGFGVAALVYTYTNPAAIKIETDKKTIHGLAQARDALVGYAAGLSYSGTERPGNLPCPDANDNGSGESSCDTPASRVGRLPWKTLGLPDLRDGYGERLWYAVSVTFKKYHVTGVLNSDTTGDLSVSGTVAATGVIAIVFSAGPPLGSQDRDPSTTALCVTTGTTIARNLCAANYLEGGNEDADAAFTAGLPTNTFNDTLMLVTSDGFFPAVTTRVAREARSFLNAYYADPSNGYFPNANAFTDATYRCNPGIFQGRIPKDINAAGLGCSAQNDWNGVVIPTWFFANNWQDVIFYAVSPLCTDVANAAQCASLGGLDVSGTNPNVRALVIASGQGLAGQARPCAAATDCLEDVENTNGDDVFVKPVLSATDNDRLVIVSP